MKLTTLILITAILQVSANTYAQRISLSEKNAPLSQVFDQIRAQTGYDFFVTTSILKEAKPVTITVKDEDITVVLKKIFDEQPFEYSIDKKSVVVSKKEPSFIDKVKTALAIPIDITGKVTDSTNLALNGATVTNVTQKKSTKTAEDGTFKISANTGDQITISYVGYKLLTITAAENMQYQYILHEDRMALKEVMVNTGYQTLPKERATGSFEVIDSKKLNEQVGTNILDRLKGVSSLFFNTGERAAIPFTIRGTNTINGDQHPLIVVDNFPYDGDINNINPNNIASVTILKDAAAASIWGAQAGNGVLVITTKKGNFNQNMKVEFSAGLNLSEKQNLFAQNLLSSSDYIDLEVLKFNNGAYNASENGSNHPYLTPVVEALIAKRDNKISGSEADAIINSYRNHDVRTEFTKLQQNPYTQDYSLNISGGTHNMNYFLSGGYSNSIGVTNDSDKRINFNLGNTFKVTKDLSISTTVGYTQQSGRSGDKQSGTGFNIPYAKLMDENGNALPVSGYRVSYIDTVGNGKLLDWNRNLINDRKYIHETNDLNNFTASAEVNYRFLNDFNLSLNYQLQKQQSVTKNLWDQNSFEQRDLINQYTVIDKNTGEVTYNYPLGQKLFTQDGSSLTANNLRGMLNFAHRWNRHEVNALAGGEINSAVSGGGGSNYFFGYNADPLSYFTVNPFAEYPILFGGSGTPFAGAARSQNPINTSHSVSAFANASYSYDEKYIFSISARRDAKNVYGVNINDKWKPLWSTGIAWNINKERFYSSELFPILKLRATYGVAGNSPDQPALTIIQNMGSSGSAITGAPYSRILSFGNVDIKWEEVRTFNLAVEFSTKNNLINGSIEFYSRKDKDLFGPSIIDPTVGVGTLIPLRNVASMKASGFELALTSNNMRGVFNWKTNFQLNIQHNKVTDYYNAAANISYYLGNGTTVSPIVGQPLYSLIGYKWAGLNPENGQARVYIDGQPNSDNSMAANNANLENLSFKGSAIPTVFGSLNNSFGWRGFNLNFNIMYEFGNHFIKPSINYQNIVSDAGFSIVEGSGDFSSRWQKPGDEKVTDIPALQYPFDSSSALYNSSDVLVKKGDNIRLQYINLNYNFSKKMLGKLPFSNLSVGVNVSNLGIIWRANKDGLDPDNLSGLPIPKSYSFRISTNF